MLSNYDDQPDKNSSLSTSNSTNCDRTDHFLHGNLGLKCTKRRLLKNWLKANCETQLLKTVIGWCCLHLFLKAIHISSTEKFTEWLIVGICCNKEQKRRSRTPSLHKNDVQSIDAMACQNYATSVWHFVDPGVKIDEAYYYDLLSSPQLHAYRTSGLMASSSFNKAVL